MDTLKSWAAWLWDWITVITGTVVGFLYVAFDLISAIGGDHLVPFFGADLALKIVSGVAIAKGAIAFFQSRQEA
jgi:hypothetical protein